MQLRNFEVFTETAWHALRPAAPATPDDASDLVSVARGLSSFAPCRLLVIAADRTFLHLEDTDTDTATLLHVSQVADR